jgi:CRISPR-associated exonuclease Cas4
MFYNEIKHRVEIQLTPAIKHKVKLIAAEMQDYYIRRHTPRVKTGSFCRSCSLQHICLPELMNKRTVKSYVEGKMKE